MTTATFMGSGEPFLAEHPSCFDPFWRGRVAEPGQVEDARRIEVGQVCERKTTVSRLERVEISRELQREGIGLSLPPP